MHGVGHTYASEAFRCFGLPPFRPVEEQQYPDPDFPSVKFPNPEEKGKCDLASVTRLMYKSLLNRRTRKLHSLAYFISLLASFIVVGFGSENSRFLWCLVCSSSGSGCWSFFCRWERVGESSQALNIALLKIMRKTWRNVAYIHRGRTGSHSGFEVLEVLHCFRSTFAWVNRVINTFFSILFAYFRCADKLAMIASTVSSKIVEAMAVKEGFRFEECLTGKYCPSRHGKQHNLRQF